MSIIEEIKNEMAKGIKKVLDGKSSDYETELPIWPELVESHLETLGYEKGDFDCNGWQYDWWMNFTKEDEKFTASGSGYSGGFQFAPTEE